MNKYKERIQFLEEENKNLKAKLLNYESENIIEVSDYQKQLELMVKKKTSEAVARHEDWEKLSRRQEILIKVLNIVQSSEDLVQAMKDSISEIGKYANVSRVHVFEKNADRTKINNTIEWCNDDIEPIQNVLQDLPVELAKAWFEMFDEGKYVCASDSKIFPPDLTKKLVECGVQSIAVFPITSGGVHYGFVDFNECSENRVWEENEIELFKSLAQIISTTKRRFQAESTIKQSQDTLLAVINNITAYIIVTDLKTMKILYANDNMKKKTRMDLVGMECWKAVQGQEDVCSFCHVKNLLDENNNPTGVYHYEQYNKVFKRYLSIDSMAFEWIDGHIAQMEIAMDITDQKRVEKELTMERDRLKAIGDNFPGGALLRFEIDLITQTKRLSYLSDTWTSITGLDIQKSLEDFSYVFKDAHPEDIENLMVKIEESVRLLEHFDEEIRLVLPSGEMRWMQISSHPHFLNETTVVSDGFILDITDRKKVENELENYRINLESIVQERTEELEAAYEEMEATNEELEQYKNLLELLVQKKTQELTESQQRLVSLSNNLPGGVIFQMIIDITKIQDVFDSDVVKFTFVSDTLSNLLGIKSNRLFENSALFFEMIVPEDKEKFISTITKIENNKLFDFESRFIIKNDEIKWIHIRAISQIANENTWTYEGFMLDVTDRKKTEIELNEYRKRQNVLIKVLQVVQSSENLENAINAALLEIGKYTDVSRTYIFEKSYNNLSITNTYEWCNRGITPEKYNLQEVSIEPVQRWFDLFEKGEFIYASDISNLPEIEREKLEPEGIKSILVLPLIINDNIYGFIGFDDCKTNREWVTSEIRLLMNLSHIIADATRRFKAESAIHLSQQTMRTVLDNLDACVYVAQFETGEILFANKQIKELFGENIEGKVCWDTFGEQERHTDMQLLKNKALSEQTSFQWENKNVFNDRWYYCIDSAIEWIDGQIVRLQYATDITDRKDAEDSLKKSEELYRILTVASPDAILVLDINTTIKFISEKAKELFRVNDDIKLENINVLDYTHFQDPKHTREFLLKFARGNLTSMPQLLLRRDDGTKFYGEISSAPIKENGKIISFIIVIRDVTERKQIELDIIRAKENAEEADFLKSAFLANMSHEIRTPMNGILGFASLIQLEVDEDITPRTAQYAQIINDNCQSLLHLLDDIIDISKLESKQLKLVLVETKLNSLLSDLHILYEQILRDKGKTDLVEIILDLSVFEETVMVDSTRLQQVLTNLISNSIKFTETGTINFGFERIDDENLLFYVRDSGIGIHKKYCEVIFERFRQVDENRQMNIGGTGLGLAISKNLVEIMGGKIWVESEMGVGSTFYFTIKANGIG